MTLPFGGVGNSGMGAYHGKVLKHFFCKNNLDILYSTCSMMPILLFILSGKLRYVHSLQVHFHQRFGIHWGKGWSPKISPLQRLNFEINVQSTQKP